MVSNKLKLVEALAKFAVDERKEIMALAERLHQAIHEAPPEEGEVVAATKPKVKRRRKRRALGPALPEPVGAPNLDATFPPEE